MSNTGNSNEGTVGGGQSVNAKLNERQSEQQPQQHDGRDKDISKYNPDTAANDSSSARENVDDDDDEYMAEENEQSAPRTLLTQVTDLDDQDLDERAGLFVHSRIKSQVKAQTERPKSQPFFQPKRVFGDMLQVQSMVDRQEQNEAEMQQQQQQQRQDNPLINADVTTADNRLKDEAKSEPNKVVPTTAVTDMSATVEK
ncbi:hypothetical protein EV182_006416, partial [Spiromyces aspiralis]